MKCARCGLDCYETELENQGTEEFPYMCCLDCSEATYDDDLDDDYDDELDDYYDEDEDDDLDYEEDLEDDAV